MAQPVGNVRLKAARRNAGFASQQAFADALTRAAPKLGLGHLVISVWQVRRWESAAPPWPAAAHQRLLVHLLHLPLEELGFTPPGRPGRTDSWISQLSDPAPEMRVRAAKKLGELGDLQALPVLEAAFKDRDPDVRRAIGEALMELDHIKAASMELDQIKESGESRVVKPKVATTKPRAAKSQGTTAKSKGATAVSTGSRKAHAVSKSSRISNGDVLEDIFTSIVKALILLVVLVILLAPFGLPLLIPSLKTPIRQTTSDASNITKWSTREVLKAADCEQVYTMRII